ncbi:DUF2254 family protein [Tomitella fengzijianii]|uniref:DUF2254 domain-containing protein n=1 Tax=Tomitella fengzijianii TaxID=2597660 RepID=A0A516X679_9ACTN|nr:DUF2254 family protein [Tomitella fengzijianii]QDQ98574.1 DUF2254 domain-containing protein [Tomitella fengzijianii]
MRVQRAVLDLGRVPKGKRPVLRMIQRRRRVRASVVTVVYVAAGAGIGVAAGSIRTGPMVQVDPVVQLLAAVAGGLLTLIGIVISLLFLVVQFAVTAQSPRLNLFRDNPLITHLYALMLGVLVNVVVAGAMVYQKPTVSVAVPAVVIVLLIVSLLLLRVVQVAAIRAVQLAPILEAVGARARDVIDALYPEAGSVSVPSASGFEDKPCCTVRWPNRTARLRQVDFPALVRRLGENGCRARMVAGPGKLLREGDVVLQVHGDSCVRIADELLLYFEVGLERNFDQDPTFGFRLLNDIALRALSSAVNDPYTAIQAIDEIEALLRALATRELRIGELCDADGELRLVFETPTWDQFVGYAVDELFDGMRSIRSVHARIAAMLAEVRAIAPPERWDALDRRARELAARTAAGGDAATTPPVGHAGS